MKRDTIVQVLLHDLYGRRDGRRSHGRRRARCQTRRRTPGRAIQKRWAKQSLAFIQSVEGREMLIQLEAGIKQQITVHYRRNQIILVAEDSV